MIHFAAGRVVIDHFFKRGQAAIVHVRGGKRDVPQRGRSKLADILRSLGMLIETAVWRRIQRYARVRKPAARIAFRVSIPVSFERDCSEIPASVTLPKKAMLSCRTSYCVCAASSGADILMETMLFEVEGLSKRFGQIAALEDVSFHVRVGEVLGLIGPNGAGKSTLFECLAGVLPSDRGTIRAADRAVGLRERSTLLFFVPDGIAPWPAQSVGWALDFTIGFLRGRAALRDEVVGQLDLHPLLHQPIATLSKGQRKRALLGIGLLTSQPALLIDEPFDGLDLRQARDVAAALQAHAARGRTLFLSIHQISDAERFCDRFILLSSGRVRGEGTVQELAALAATRASAEVNGHLEEVFLALT